MARNSTILLAALLLGLSQPVAAGELLVDDFKDGDLRSQLGLDWIVLADEVLGGGSHARLGLSSEGRRGLLWMEGELKLTDHVNVSFVGAWTPVGEDGRARDLSSYQGLRLRARARNGSYQVGLRLAGTATNFSSPLELGRDWREIEVPFSSLRPLSAPGSEPPQWNASAVSWVGISSAGREDAAVHLEVDRVAFYGGPSAQKAAPSAAAEGSPTVTTQLASAPSLAALAWQPLVREEAGDALRPTLPDAVALSWATAPDGRVWFRVTLAETPPERFMGINIALDTNADPGDGMAWWGTNSGFHFDQLVTAYLTRTQSLWMGSTGVASAQEVGRGLMDGGTADVLAAIDEENRALLVGVPRAALPPQGPVWLIATVGSSMINNDDLPNQGAVALPLPPLEAY